MFKEWPIETLCIDELFSSTYPYAKQSTKPFGETKIEIYLPGIKKEDISISIVNNDLKLEWKKRDGKDASVKYRIINENLDINKILAKYENGILEIKFSAKDDIVKKIKIE